MEMLRFYWTPVVGSRAFLFLAPPMTHEAPWSRIVLTFVWTTAHLCVPNCRLLILWTMLRSHRGLLVPMNKANDILGNWSRAMRLAWCTMCPHPPPLSTEFQNAPPFFEDFRTSSALTLGWDVHMKGAGIPRLWLVQVIIKFCFLSN